MRVQVEGDKEIFALLRRVTGDMQDCSPALQRIAASMQAHVERLLASEGDAAGAYERWRTKQYPERPVPGSELRQSLSRRFIRRVTRSAVAVGVERAAGPAPDREVRVSEAMLAEWVGYLRAHVSRGM